MSKQETCKVCNTPLIIHYAAVCPLCAKGKRGKKYNYLMMQHYIEAKYNIKDLRDYAITIFKLEKGSISLSWEHQQKWEKQHFPIPEKYTVNPKPGCVLNEEGYKWNDTREGSLFFFAKDIAYRKHPEGKCKEYPYLDFWHFIVEQIDDIENDCSRTFNWVNLKENSQQDWQKEICQLFIDEFGTKDMQVEISW